VRYLELLFDINSFIQSIKDSNTATKVLILGKNRKKIILQEEINCVTSPRLGYSKTQN
jgi:hypothetical protein